MDLPTYTNIWRIEKRLYKLYDLRLPMPLPLVQIGVFLGVFVPWIVMLRFAGIPFESPWHVLYIVPPGVLTWLATRPVIEGKRLTELLISQSRYLAEPRTWCRLTPIREPREVVIVARVWRRAEAPAPVAAPERAAIKSRRKRKQAAAQPATAHPAAVPVLLPRPSAAPAPPSLADYAAQHPTPPTPAAQPPTTPAPASAAPAAPAAPAPAASVAPAPPKPWRRTTRDISHEDDVQAVPADLEHPPATPQVDLPPPAPPPRTGQRAFAAGVRRPRAPTHVWPVAAPPTTRPDIPQQTPQADTRPTPEAVTNATPAPPAEQARQAGEEGDIRVAGGAAAGSGEPPREQVWSEGEMRRDVRQEPPAAAEPARQDLTKRDAPDEGQRLRQRSNGEIGDKKVAGRRTPPPRQEPAAPPAAAQSPAAPPAPSQGRTGPWTPQQGPQQQGPPPPVTRPDVPVVPGAFGSRPEEPPANGARPAEEVPAPRMEAPRPWSKGLSKPLRAVPEPAPEPEPEAPPVEPHRPGPVEEQQAPPREVRSQPASPVRPRPLPPPPAPPPSGPAITPPDPEHEVTGGGLRRLFHAVGGGHGDVDAEYQQRLQQPFRGTRHVVVLGCTGGAGQTVTALMLGHTFAQHNGEPIVAVDVNPGPGALARRTRSDTNETLTGLITRADQVGSLTAMRRYTSQAKSGLDVIAAGKNPLQALDDRDYALAIRTIDRFYSVTLLDAAAAVVARVLPYADQLVLVAPASADAPRAVAMTFEWLDGHGYEELRSRAVTVINGVSRRSMDDVEQAESMARGRCRALVRIPWDDHLSMDRAPRNELKSLRSPTRRAYLALAGVVAGGFTVMPERYQEFEHEQEATR
ncbi:TcpE family conjugal transfer membrane protein [Actinomadura sp. 1N219]|uniref:TcpE family conjugal transfer membrane protein n=1 Tax=Actinomadura sp. 1N219 TaxID=3375152 RepID=UPI0037BB875F